MNAVQHLIPMIVEQNAVRIRSAADEAYGKDHSMRRRWELAGRERLHDAARAQGHPICSLRCDMAERANAIAYALLFAPRPIDALSQFAAELSMMAAGLEEEELDRQMREKAALVAAEEAEREAKAAAGQAGSAGDLSAIPKFIRGDDQAATSAPIAGGDEPAGDDDADLASEPIGPASTAAEKVTVVQ